MTLFVLLIVFVCKVDCNVACIVDCDVVCKVDCDVVCNCVDCDG